MTTERPLESGIRRDLSEELTYSDYLRLDLRFFPELWYVRTEIGR